MVDKKSDVIVHDQEERSRPIALNLVENFRNRGGWCVVATTKDAYGQDLDYEWTKQYPEPHGAMEAMTEFMRVGTVESQEE